MENLNTTNKPNYSIGQRTVYADNDFGAIDNNMVIEAEPTWYPYDNHPNGGYWEYQIVDKANSCPADCLVPYEEGKDSFDYSFDIIEREKKLKNG